MSTDFATLVSDNLDVWTSAVERKSGVGRGSGKRLSLYGIERLRLLILDLAVRGKLVAQNVADEPAAEALGRIAKARKAKVAAGLARNPKAIAALPDDLPEVPPGWVWTQLGAIAEISPSNQAADDIDVSFVPMALVSTSVSGEHEAETRRWGDVRKGFTHFAEGDIGLAKITPCFENGKAAIFQNLHNGIGAGTTELHVARPWSDDIDRRYVLMTMKTASYLAKGEKQMTGTAGQKRVTRGYFEASPLSLPPLAEQQRIVAKVDELMALCDALETHSASALEARQSLVETLLATLVDATDSADLARQWARMESHFDSLFTTEHSIGALRQTVLELAVRGKLVEQNGEDRTAAALLTDTGGSQSQTRSGAKPQHPALAEEKRPYDLPPGWIWASFDQIAKIRAELVRSLDHPDAFQIAPDIIEKGTGKLLAVRTVEEAGVRGPNSRFYAGQIIYSKIRPSLSKAVIAEFDGLCSADMYPLDTHIDPSFLLKTILSEPFLRQVRAAENRIKMPKLNKESLGSFIVAVPPLAEQRRIVAKVDELFALCEALDARLAGASQTRRQLSDAVVERAAA